MLVSLSELLPQGVVIFTLLSILGTFSGILCFKDYPHHGAAIQGKHLTSRRGLYWFSLIPSFCWYVIPFLPQPRFASLWQGVQHRELLPLTVGLLALAVALHYGRLAMKVVNINLKSTGPAMRNFLAPHSLLVQGPYARVRHPMFLFDFMTHTGVAVAAGAVTGVALLPIYYALSASICVAEERWILAPRFGESFQRYMSDVPGYMHKSEAVVLIVLGFMICLLWATH